MGKLGYVVSLGWHRVVLVFKRRFNFGEKSKLIFQFNKCTFSPISTALCNAHSMKYQMTSHTLKDHFGLTLSEGHLRHFCSVPCTSFVVFNV